MVTLLTYPKVAICLKLVAVLVYQDTRVSRKLGSFKVGGVATLSFSIVNVTGKLKAWHVD